MFEIYHLNLKLYYYLFVILFVLIGTVKSKEILYWKIFQRALQECRVLIKQRNILRQFYNRRGRFPICKSYWCGTRYTPTENVLFLAAKFLDDNGMILEDPGGNKRFMEARNGDHQIVLLHCELCHAVGPVVIPQLIK